MERITRKDLERLVEKINTLEKADTKASTVTLSRVGAYELSGAYGGYQLHQIVNKDGGVRTLLSDGHVPKRELHGLLRAYISGYTAFTLAKIKEATRGV